MGLVRQLRSTGHERVRCAYCHDAAGNAAPCPSCGTRVHTECLAQAGACPTLGCPRQQHSLPEDQPDRRAQEERQREARLARLWLHAGVALLVAVLPWAAGSAMSTANSESAPALAIVCLGLLLSPVALLYGVGAAILALCDTV